MSIWKWKNNKYEKVQWFGKPRTEKAVIYGSAMSLLDADKEPENAVKFVQNMAYKTVTPDIWVGMDLPEVFGKELLDTPFPKVLRCNYANEKCNGIPAKEYPETYFMDVVPGLKAELMFRLPPSLGTIFYFNWNTMQVALHLILWMGFKHIVFSGIDLQGIGYADGRKLTKAKQEEIPRLLNQEFEWMKTFVESANKYGVKLENTSETSRLKELMS